MKKALLKDSIKQIKKTYKRFISILLMAFMGVGFFAGVRATSPDMKKTLDMYLDKYNVYDINIVSTLGITDDDIDAISKIDGVEKAFGTYSEDVFATVNDEEIVVKAYAIYENDINKLEFIEGSLPQNEDECVIESSMKQGLNLGDYIEVRENLLEDEESSFKTTKLKVVGIVKSPLYISRDRGTTTLGSGKITYYMYVNKNNIISDIYTGIDVIAKESKNYNAVSDEYDELISKVEKNIEKVKEERQNARYNELIEEANKKLNDAQVEFDKQKADGEKKIQDAEKEIADGKNEIKKGEKELKYAEKELAEGKSQAEVEFTNAEAQISAAETKLAMAQTEINDGNALLSAKKQEAETGISQLQTGINTLNSKINELQENKALVENVLSTISKLDETLVMLNTTLVQYEQELANATGDTTELVAAIDYVKTQIANMNAEKKQLESYGMTGEKLDQINAGILECQNQKVSLENQLNQINMELTEAENKLLSGQNQIAAGYQELASSKATLVQKRNETAQKFVDAEKEISKGKKEIQDAKKKIADGEKELADKKQEFNEKILDAEGKLIEAREKVNDIENAKWYIFDRNDNSGFSSYSQDTGNVEKLGEAFPIVFFIIATLISLTTMSRMVEEERVQIGTLKALGYNKMQIMSKYIIYSLLASLIGGVLGAIFGLEFFPRIIISMYQMMYDISEMVIEINKYYMIMGITIMSICIVGATIYTASKELVNTPSELMRPKAPKAGKRVLIEKIPFIWNRFNFTQKVTARNMFRYKKRFLMTVVGICGCTALIVAGFGLKDSISKIMDYQYIDIYDYDMLIGLKNTLTKEEINVVKGKLENEDSIESCTEIYLTSENVKNGELEKEAQILVVENSEALDKVVRLKDLKTSEKLSLNDNEVIITDKLSQLINVRVGDEIILSDSDENEYKVKVGGITEHYISHYIYMTKSTYENLFKKEVSTNVLLTKYTNKIDENEEYELSEKILKDSKIASITLTSYLIQIMDDTLNAMNLVVYVLIVSAGVLAFIVLYNLSNINISERIRELATIKVLGFYDKEVYDYVTREIIVLTVIGIVFGLIFGYILNSFILGTCEIEMLRFKRIILPQSYLYASLITIIFTLVVNFITYFSLKKVDMIESLKSIE